MIQLDIRSRSRTKNPTPTPSVVRNPTPPKNLRLLTTPQPWFSVELDWQDFFGPIPMFLFFFADNRCRYFATLKPFPTPKPWREVRLGYVGAAATRRFYCGRFLIVSTVSYHQDCGARTQISGSGSRHPRFFAPAPITSKIFASGFKMVLLIKNWKPYLHN